MVIALGPSADCVFAVACGTADSPSRVGWSMRTGADLSNRVNASRRFRGLQLAHAGSRRMRWHVSAFGHFRSGNEGSGDPCLWLPARVKSPSCPNPIWMYRSNFSNSWAQSVGPCYSSAVLDFGGMTAFCSPPNWADAGAGPHKTWTMLQDQCRGETASFFAQCKFLDANRNPYPIIPVVTSSGFAYRCVEIRIRKTIFSCYPALKYAGRLDHGHEKFFLAKPGFFFRDVC